MKRDLLILLGFFATLNLSTTQLSRADDGGALVYPPADHTATLLADGRVLLVGGLALQSGGIVATPNCEVYNPSTNTWTATGSLKQARHLAGTVLLPDGRVLTMGGDPTGGFPLSSAEIYFPATGVWSVTTSMHKGRADLYGLYPILLPNGEVLIPGGSSDAQTCELYDPATATWTFTGSLLHKRFGLHATLLTSGKVLVAGGQAGSKGFVAQCELYDPATGTWSDTGALSVARADNVQVLLASGGVLVAGGYFGRPSDLTVTSSTEIYDPGTGLWQTAGAMLTPRVDFTANLLNDGKVFAAGGANQPTEVGLDSIEEFNPSAGRWRQLRAMLAPARYKHTTTTLLDGSLILAGGYVSGFGDFAPDGELFVRPR
ncbi:MAG: kelch repeat-containing protein [Chthoniobacterales bacterium]